MYAHLAFDHLHMNTYKPQNLDLHLSLGNIIFAFSIKSTLLCIRSSH